MEYASYNQVKLLKKCIGALKHRYRIDDEQAASKIRVKLPLADNSFSQANRAIKDCFYFLGVHSLKEYWGRVNAKK